MSSLWNIRVHLHHSPLLELIALTQPDPTRPTLTRSDPTRPDRARPDTTGPDRILSVKVPERANDRSG